MVTIGSMLVSSRGVARVGVVHGVDGGEDDGRRLGKSWEARAPSQMRWEPSRYVVEVVGWSGGGGERCRWRRVLVTVMLAVVFSLVPPVLVRVELGFRGWPSASAGPTVKSGASGDGGAVLGACAPALLQRRRVGRLA